MSETFTLADRADCGKSSGLAAKPELRVFQVFNTLGVGGAETWLMALLRYFREAVDRLRVRVRTDILLTGGEPGTFDKAAEALGARLLYVKYGRRELLRFRRDFREILRQGRYHAIHDHQDYAAGLHFLLGLGLLPPVRVAHVHNPLLPNSSRPPDLASRAAAIAGKRLLAHLATHVMGTSREILNTYGFLHPRFRHVVRGAAHCGFDVSQYCGNYIPAHRSICEEFGWEQGARLILFVGRLNTVFKGNLNQKNPEFALEVGRHCVARDPAVRLLMAGSGEEMRRALEERVRDWGLQGHMRLIGVRADVPRLMLGADLLLFPSVAEGLGMVVVEAQAAGLRVLASDATPRESAAVPGVVTFLPLQDGPARWAEEVLWLLSQPRADRNACNRSVLKSPFSIENSADRLLRLYQGQLTE